MVTRPLMTATAVAWLAAAFVGPAQAQDAAQQVSPELAECIRDNADRYLAEARPVYFISIAGCLDGRALADQTTASSATPDTSIPTLPDAEAPALVVLTPVQIRCLRDQYSRVVEPLDGIVPVMMELRFDGC